MCKMYDRVCRLEKELAMLCIQVKDDSKIAKLEDKIVKLELKDYIDVKTCHSIQGKDYITRRQIANPLKDCDEDETTVTV